MTFCTKKIEFSHQIPEKENAESAEFLPDFRNLPLDTAADAGLLMQVLESFGRFFYAFLPTQHGLSASIYTSNLTNFVKNEVFVVAKHMLVALPDRYKEFFHG